ncbi:aspartate aminotransferase-like enzyme [Bradyrhizobium sp. i1.3.1]
MHQGRHFLQIPGPSPVPERVLRAMDMPVIDHRSAEFGELGRAVLEGSQTIFQTAGPVVIFPSSGTGAWEAAIVNTLSPGDRVLMVETGHFATLWRQMAGRFGIEVDFVPGDWRRGADPALIEAKLTEDKARAIKAVMVVHNETSTGATSRIAEIRAAIDRTAHPAPADGGHHLLARLGRLPPRRVEGRCQRELLAEGFHVAARSRLQRDLGEGPRRREDQQDAALLFRLGGDAQA